MESCEQILAMHHKAKEEGNEERHGWARVRGTGAFELPGIAGEL